MEKRGTGSFHIGTRGEGIIYVSKRLLSDFPLASGDQVRITVKEDGTIIVEKL
jgi:hypothetical protein